MYSKLTPEEKKEAHEIRKNLFKGKTDILDNGFYEKIPDDVKNGFKKNGALSICEPFVKNGSLHSAYKRFYSNR